MKTDFFDPVRLDEMNEVKLMNRVDRKYWFHLDRLENLLHSIKNDYFILNIDGQSILPYATSYFDTTQNNMYTSHVNGKLNRYKVRRRTYVSTGISFLEVKFKSNKGKTIKKRIPSEFGNTILTDQEHDFLRQYIPYNTNELQPSLFNSFSRITLANKNFTERCTIDLNLQFEIGDKMIALGNLVIVEIKSAGRSNHSALSLALREQRIKSAGFSKYIVGRTLTDFSLKRNAYKQKIRSIEKTIHTNNNLYYLN